MTNSWRAWVRWRDHVSLWFKSGLLNGNPSPYPANDLHAAPAANRPAVPRPYVWNEENQQTRTIIDGQQRFTTLQLLLDALHSELMAVEATGPALRIEALVRNQDPFCSKPEDQFKVWPTNRDRLAFNAVMGAKPPVSYEAVGHKGERMVEAHRYFSEQARDWLNAAGTESRSHRAAIEGRRHSSQLGAAARDLEREAAAAVLHRTVRKARGAG